MSTGNQLTTVIAWWLTGLGYLVPAPVRRLVQHLPDRITVEFKDQGQQLLCKHYPGDATSPDAEQVFILDRDMQNADLSRWLQGQGVTNTEIALLVPEDMILQKALMLPAAAGQNLRQVLGFEMDRRTPFAADQIYFDYLLDREDKENHQLHIQLYITPRQQVDRLLAILGGLGINPDTLAIAGPRQNSGLNLLPPEQRQVTSVNQSHTLTAFLALSAFALLLAVLYLPLLEQEDSLKHLEADIAGSKEVVAKLQGVKLQKDALLEKAGFLATKRNNYIPVIDLLLELTRIIPDDTALNRFYLADGKIQLQGESANASQMIQSIESSEMLTDVKFSAPVIYNEASRKDKFSISAQLSGTRP